MRAKRITVTLTVDDAAAVVEALAYCHAAGAGYVGCEPETVPADVSDMLARSQRVSDRLVDRLDAVDRS